MTSNIIFVQNVDITVRNQLLCKNIKQKSYSRKLHKMATLGERGHFALSLGLEGLKAKDTVSIGANTDKALL